MRKHCLLAVVLSMGTSFSAFCEQVNHENSTPTTAELKTPLAHPVHDPAFASTWYPDNPQALETFLTSTKPHDAVPLENVTAIIVPHAGYKFSGHVAAATYGRLEPATFKKVVVLAPSHYTHFKGIALPTYTAYRTPLGLIPVADDCIHFLQKQPLFHKIDLNEHALEAQLPFIQKYVTGASLVPLIVGEVEKSNIESIAHAIHSCIDAQTLIVVSSDFTHYGSRFNFEPFKKDVHDLSKKIEELDMQVCTEIERKDPYRFLSFTEQHDPTICGAMPIAIMLKLLSPDSTYHFVRYGTSTTQAKTPNDSVSYAGIAFTQPPFSREEKKTLLRLARASILKTGPLPPKTAHLMKNRGAFVTLHKNGILRGCIGSIFPVSPLYETVHRMAQAAAFDDMRFPPVRPEEMGSVKISISILTEPKSSTIDRIVLGRDGILLFNRGQSAVFLPKIAQEQGWDLKTTLEELSLKGWGSQDIWKDPRSSFSTFESIDFEE